MSKHAQEAELGWTREATGRPEKNTSANLLIQDLLDSNTRERALEILSMDRSIREDLAPTLWNSFGAIASLLQEVITAYLSLHSPTMTEPTLKRVLNTLALLQAVATHAATKKKFLEAKIHCYLYPFLNNTCTGRPQQFIRLSSLGVIGALVKNDSEVVVSLLESQLFPCCLVSIDVGDNRSKTVATFIVQKIMETKEGLKYCCVIAERSFAIIAALGNMVEKLFTDGNLADAARIQLLKRIICCYLRLSEHPRGCEALRQLPPLKLLDASFITILQRDEPAFQSLQQLCSNLDANYNSKAQRVARLSKPQASSLLSPSRQPARDLLDHMSKH